MLKKIYIDGFRHFKNFSFEPYEQNTLLSGLNGTGKTTIVEVQNRLQLFLTNSLPVTALCGMDDIPIWDIKEYGSSSTTLGIAIDVGDANYSYELEVRHNFKESICRVEKETLIINGSSVFSSAGGNAEVTTDDDRHFSYPVDWNFTGLMVAKRSGSKIRDFLGIIQENLFSVSINPFAISSEHQESESILKLDGTNFSAWYDYLRDKQLAVIASTFSEIGSFVPGFKQFTFDQEGKSKELIADILISKSQAYRLPFKSLSHGQKILCLLHLLIRVCPTNSTIFIDEFENFLSPIELQPLYDVAQSAFEEKNTQFIFVSHHQKTMNWFQDSAFILSFSGSPAFVRIEKFISDSGITIAEHLMANQEVDYEL